MVKPKSNGKKPSTPKNSTTNSSSKTPTSEPKINKMTAIPKHLRLAKEAREAEKKAKFQAITRAAETKEALFKGLPDPHADTNSTTTSTTANFLEGLRLPPPPTAPCGICNTFGHKTEKCFYGNNGELENYLKIKPHERNSWMANVRNFHARKKRERECWWCGSEEHKTGDCGGGLEATECPFCKTMFTGSHRCPEGTKINLGTYSPGGKR